MRKIVFASMLALALCLLLAATAAAAPLSPAGEGFSVFAEYDTDFYGEFTIGAGYGFNENLTIGVFCVPEYEDFGLYGNLAIGQFLVNGEILLDDYFFGTVSVLYIFDLDQVTFGLGGGFDFYEDYDDEEVFVEVMAEVDLESSLSIYGSYKYWPDYEYSTFKIGLSYAF